MSIPYSDYQQYSDAYARGDMTWQEFQNALFLIGALGLVLLTAGTSLGAGGLLYVMVSGATVSISSIINTGLIMSGITIIGSLGFNSAIKNARDNGEISQQDYQGLKNNSDYIMGMGITGIVIGATYYLLNNTNSNSNNNSITGTTYNSKDLYKTQPDHLTTRAGIENAKERILNNGPNSVSPIPVRVHQGQALIVDGHHRYQAFVELGYDRVPIEYISENQIYTRYGRTLQELLNMMFK